MNVGFIGIGQMGRHMARNLLKAGHSLTINDLFKDAAKELLDAGAKWADTPREVAAVSQIVVTSLPAPPDVEAVVYGPSGLEAGWKKGDIYIDMSTNSPTTVRKIAESARAKGVAVLDAPVSGATVGAEAGTLAIMVGGDKATLEQAMPVLEAMGKKIVHLGEVGCGNIAKLVNNMIAIACGVVSAEGFVLGVKAGIDPQALYDVVTSGTGNNWSLGQFPNSVFKGNWAPTYRLSLASKDMGLVTQLGREMGVPLLVGSVVDQKLIDAKTAGLADNCVDAAIVRLEELTGVQVRTK